MSVIEISLETCYDMSSKVIEKDMFRASVILNRYIDEKSQSETWTILNEMHKSGQNAFIEFNSIEGIGEMVSELNAVGYKAKVHGHIPEARAVSLKTQEQFKRFMDDVRKLNPSLVFNWVEDFNDEMEYERQLDYF